jgi:parallel beta-helix repeat protein
MRKKYIFIMLITLFLMLISVMGTVSAASYTISEVEQLSTGIKSYTESHGNVPGYVDISSKNSTTPSFLKTLAKTTVQLNSGSTAPVTISSVAKAPSPSGSATGTLYKSEYVTVANNLNSFINTNNRAPNFMSSSIGNIRYESLVYTYSKVVDFYRYNDRLPNYVTVSNVAGIDSTGVVIDNVAPTVSNNLASGSYNTIKTVTLTATDHVDPNPKVYYSTNGGSTWSYKTKTVTLTFGQGVTTLKYYGKDATGNTGSTQTRTYTISTAAPPIVISIDPANNAVNVPVNKVIKVTFNEPIKAGSLWIELKNNGGTSIPITKSISGSILTIKPINSLAGGRYTLTLHTGSITDLENNPLALCGFRFNVTNTVQNVNTGTTYPSIQAAVNAASAHNTIQVGTGIYTENIVIFKALNLKAAAGANVIIQALDPAYATIGIDSGGNGTKITGFTLQGATNSTGILLYYAKNCNITGNTIMNNENGIFAYYSNNSSISENYISHNSVGIFTYCSNNNTISKTDVENNDDGIFLYNSNNNTISENNAENNNNGICIDTSNKNIISRNKAINNALKGILVDNSNNTNIIGNTATDNIQVGIFLSYSNSTLISGNDVKNNGINGTIYGGIIIGYSNNTIISGNNATNNTENGILLYKSEDNTISGNNATKNTVGINLQNASNNTISMNKAVENIRNGILLLYSSNSSILENTISNNLDAGVYLDNSDSNEITENIITNNHKGIYLYFSPATVNFNRITGNNVGGLVNAYSNPVNATNNWWGTNTPTVSSSSISDICILGGNVIYNPWIVLTVNSVYFRDGIFNVTADLTHNNQGTNLLPLGHIPDGITVNFITDYGTIGAIANTINGKAISQLNSTTNGIANVTVSLDNQIVSTTISLYKIFNTVTQKGFASIQAAIDDPSTSDGDVIEIRSGTYRENVVINKNLTIRALTGGNVTLQALNSSNSIITINPGLTVTIYNITFKNGDTSNGGAIYNSGNLTVSGSTFTGTHATNGGAIYNRGNLTVFSSTFTNNTATNGGAIYNYGGNASINFNRIVGNSANGIYNVNNGTINATNNWWGTNTPIYSTSSLPYADILNQNGTVNYNPWLVLNVNTNPVNTIGNSTVTADLTHNSNNEDTSSGGHIPDNIPVNFTTNLGTITSTAYTRNGKATLTFNPGTITLGTANITATLDGMSVQTNITIDAIAPTVNASLVGGLYNDTQHVNLTASDNLDLNPVIYYTTDGSTPTVSSAIYTSPVTLTTTTTLKFIAVDFTGNQSPIGTEHYIFTLIGNLNTGMGYSSIQSAIDDPLTVDDNVIVVTNGTYTENIVVNKNLILRPYDGNVIIQAANPNNPVITVNSSGSGSMILGFTLTGANGTSSSGIYLNQASNCTIMENILCNNCYGMLLFNSINNIVCNNNLTSNLMGGIQLNSSNNNTIYSNNITNNSGNGIYINNSENTLIMANIIQNNLMNGVELNNSNNSTIYENTIVDNHQNGIKVISSSADVNFNIITGNTHYGLYNIGNGTVNATTNWWGRNNPVVSSSIGSDIYIAGGSVTHDPWLVLNLTGSTITVTHDSTSDSDVTADLTHNSQGDDTSSSGTIPDGLPVNFTTTLGTINGTGTTRSGKAKVTLTSNTSDGATTVTATLNNQIVSKAFHKSFSSIQAAVSDPLTVDGDVILVTNGTYTENIVVNKTLTIISEGNVTVQALNSSNPVFNINSGGSGSIIHGFTVTGGSIGISLNSAYGCTVSGNNASYNAYHGIWLSGSNNNKIYGNNVFESCYGIFLTNSSNNILSQNNLRSIMEYPDSTGVHIDTSQNNSISDNNITDNDQGIFLSNSQNNFVSGNVITDNNTGMRVCNSDIHIYGNNIYNGIYLYDSSGDIHFNSIIGHGLSNIGNGTVNATNNWWGSNSVTYISSPNWPSTPRNIWNQNGTVIYDPWLVLTVTPTSYKVSDGKIYEATITADLNHNSDGEYLSTLIYLPDGIPVNFTTDNGTITNTSTTVKGEASSTLVLDPNLQSGLTNVTAVVDGQSVSTAVDRSANAKIYIISTAIDLFTGQPLSLYYELPSNESVSWVSVLWKSKSSNFGTFQNEVNLIVNGVVVLNRTVSNLNYLNNKDLYSEKVWYNVNFLNWLFSESTTSKMALQSIIDQNQLQDLTGSELEAAILNIIKERNGFTDSEMYMIANYRYFTDDIATYIEYPGDAAKKITVEDPDSGELISLEFGGNPISRVSPMIYANGGYYHTYGDPLNPTSFIYRDAGYEGVRSFAFVTTKVTDEILRYWLDQENKTDSNGNLLYPDGPMRAAYGTFLSSLLMIKSHDMVADQAAAEFNVTWTRTTPIVVSVFDDAYSTVLTLECDHRFGMEVIGDQQNIVAFRYACSAAINPIEHWVMQTLFPGDGGTSITIGLGKIILNGELIDIFISNGYMVMKSENNTLFLVIDPVTGIVRDVMITDIPMSGAYCFSDLQTEWGVDHGNDLLENPPDWMDYTIFAGLAIGSVFTAAETAGMGATILALASNPVGWVIGFAIVDAYLIWNYPDIAVPANLKAIPFFGQLLALYSLQSIIRGQGEPLTPGRLEQSFLEGANLLISISENDYGELYDLLNQKKEQASIYGPLLNKQLDDYKKSQAALPPPKGDKAEFLKNLYNKAVDLINEGLSDVYAGNYVKGIMKISLGTGGIYYWGSYILIDLVPEEAWHQIINESNN